MFKMENLFHNTYNITLKKEQEYFVVEDLRSGSALDLVTNEDRAKRMISELAIKPQFMTVQGITTSFNPTSNKCYKKIDKEEAKRVTERLIEYDGLTRHFILQGVI